MNVNNELLENLDELHTTELGVIRIKRNLSLDTDDGLIGVKLKSILLALLSQETERIGM